ncbi:MAG: NAD(P)-dependent oxidoreductase [Puniceicoccales bacterium]|nr:NAD(P)-dependent oxidoreductase [Puniceicoccales bacterium]
MIAQNTRFLITGGRGLIGTELHKQLPKLGCEVRIFDIADRSGDVRDFKQLQDALDGIDAVVHLAAISRPCVAQDNPTLAIQTNVGGTRNLCEAVSLSPKPPVVLFGSSREVYGNTPSGKQTTESDPLRPGNVYALTKMEGERLVTKLRQRSNTAILRFSNVYGGINDHSDRVIPLFAKQALAGETLRVFGKDNGFDFVHVEDCARAIIATLDIMLEHPLIKTKPGFSIDPCHVTTGCFTRLIDLAKLICQITGVKENIETLPAQGVGATQFVGNPASIKRQTGWQAKIPIEEGLSRYIAQLKTN